MKDDEDLAVHASNQIGMWQSRSGLEKSVGKRVIEAMLGRNRNYLSSTQRDWAPCVTSLRKWHPPA